MVQNSFQSTQFGTPVHGLIIEIRLTWNLWGHMHWVVLITNQNDLQISPIRDN